MGEEKKGLGEVKKMPGDVKVEEVPASTIINKPKEKHKEKDKQFIKKSAKIFVNELRARLDAYFKIVVRNIRDSIPKIIGNFLVRAVQNKMQLELFKRLGEMREAVNRGLGEVC
jgi:predicted RNA-binding protein Jag